MLQISAFSPFLPLSLTKHSFPSPIHDLLLSQPTSVYLICDSSASSTTVLSLLLLTMPFLFHFLHSTAASQLFFSLVLNQCSASGPIWLCRENLYNRFSWEFMQLPPFIASTLWRLLSKFVGFEKKSWSLVKMGEIKGYFGSSREEDARNALPGSEIDGRGSLSWLSSLSRFRPREAVASIVISAWLLLHLLYWNLSETYHKNILQTDHSKLWTK